jgi:hypothetical protein
VGVRLCFRTADPTPDEVGGAILSELDQANRGTRWILCEPIGFHPEPDVGGLSGSTKLNLQPWPDEHAEAMREPAERGDFQTLLDRLADWSDRFRLTWELEVEGHFLGRIVDGACDPGLTESLEALTAVADELASFDPLTGEPTGGELFEGAGGVEPPEEGFQPRLFRPDGE